MKKTFLYGLICLAVIASVLFIFSRKFSETSISVPDNLYSNEVFGFSVLVPDGFTVNESYLNQDLGPGREIPGIEFDIATTTALGTNLSTDSHVAIEELSDVDCAPFDFLPSSNDQPLISTQVKAGDNSFTEASSSGAAAGNRYDETVFVTQKENRCYAIRYFIHSTNIGNYDPGTVAEFDRNALIKSFDLIKTSFRLQ